MRFVGSIAFDPFAKPGKHWVLLFLSKIISKIACSCNILIMFVIY